MAYYYELDIWNKSIDITKQVYKITEGFPQTELYSLVDQMKRASVSVGSNIAEWSWQGTSAGNIRFLNIAKWSAVELEAQIRISKELWFLDENQFLELLQEVNHLIRMIASFIKKKKEFENK